MRIAVPALGPILLVELRVLIAGLALLASASASGTPLDVRRRWRQYLVLGGMNSALPFVLISTATLYMPASMAAVLNATSPLFGALIAAIWIKDTLTPRKGAGLLLGLAGVAVLAGFSPVPMTVPVAFAILAMLAASASYGWASVYTKVRVTGVRPLGMATGSQLAAALLLMPLAPFRLPGSPPGPTVIAAVLLLALASTAFAYVLYFRLIVNVGPTRALTVTFLVPLFAVVWGRLFLGEAITVSMLAGCGVILLVTALVTGVRLARPRREGEPQETAPPALEQASKTQN